MYYQQGDVLVMPSSIPIGAEGEVTGHRHKVVSGRAALYLLGAAMYLRVLEDAKLFHDEHREIILPMGDYAVNFVREYDHFAEEAKRVVD
jgi:hypothetical protein